MLDLNKNPLKPGNLYKVSDLLYYGKEDKFFFDIEWPLKINETLLLLNCYEDNEFKERLKARVLLKTGKIGYIRINNFNNRIYNLEFIER